MYYQYCIIWVRLKKKKSHILALIIGLSGFPINPNYNTAILVFKE